MQKCKYLVFGCGERCRYVSILCLFFWQAHVLAPLECTPSPVLRSKKTSCFDHENCLSRAKEKPRREDEESVKSRAVSDIWNSHIGDLRWTQPLQDQQDERRIIIPMDFLGDKLVLARLVVFNAPLSFLPLLLLVFYGPLSVPFLIRTSAKQARLGLLWTRGVETLLLLAFYGPLSMTFLIRTSAKQATAGLLWTRRVETLLLLAFYGPGKWKPEELQQFVNATSEQTSTSTVAIAVCAVEYISCYSYFILSKAAKKSIM